MPETSDLPTKFELFILGQMAASQAAAIAVGNLDGTESSLLAATQQALDAGFGTPGHRASLYVDWLGQPASTAKVLQSGHRFGSAVELKFDLSTWPDMQFRVFEHPDGWAYGAGFTRRNKASIPPLSYSDGLTPWQVLRSEIESRFGPGQSVDGWNSRAELIFDLPDRGTTRLRSHRLVFDFELLQLVDDEPTC